MITLEEAKLFCKVCVYISFGFVYLGATIALLHWLWRKSKESDTPFLDIDNRK